MREIKGYMDKVGGRCKLFEIDSDYWHDSFLVEIDKFDYIIRDILEGEIDVWFWKKTWRSKKNFRRT
jgi:homoserine O-acetyltransferase